MKAGEAGERTLKPYYEHAGITIYHGDCRDLLPTLGTSVDVVVTDPPYAIPTVIAQTRQATRNFGDLSIPERYFRDWLADLDRCLTLRSRLFVFCNQTSYPVLFRSFYSACDVQLLVWDKGRIGMGRDFRKTFELIAYARKFGADPIARDGTAHEDILEFAPLSSEERIHPAEKPVEMLAYLIGRCGDGIVLDPFSGSGSTLVAAKSLGRLGIGIEIEEKYCEIAAKRLSQEVLNFGEVRDDH